MAAGEENIDGVKKDCLAVYIVFTCVYMFPQNSDVLAHLVPVIQYIITYFIYSYDINFSNSTPIYQCLTSNVM